MESGRYTNYDTRRQDRLSSQASTSALALAIRGRHSYRKGKGDRERSKSKPGFKDLKKTSVPSAKKLCTEKLIVQRPKVRRSQRLRQISHRWSILMPVLHRRMDQTQTHQCFLSLLLLLPLVTQEIMSGS